MVWLGVVRLGKREVECEGGINKIESEGGGGGGGGGDL